MAARKGRQSLLAFTEYTLPQYKRAAHHQLIAEKLEAVERGEIDRLMIFMPPRHGKSELASKRFPAWCLGRDPQRQIIAASYNSDLASDFGRNVRNIVAAPEFGQVFPGVSLAPDSQAANRMNTNRGGTYVAAGVGTAVTGRGADIALIDDPFKDREEADSERRRETVWDWYRSTLYTRLMPGGAIVLIQCMTGDTPVLMANGKEKPLRDVRPGDMVATYERGAISAAKVMNWANQGPDRLSTIKMTSGKTVRANARHPFLVMEQGREVWRRTDTLRPGQSILTVIGANGATFSAPRMGAACQPSARWHEDDLAGRLLEHEGEQWDVLELPALHPDRGALWPEWYDEAALLRIKETIGPREWSALYQQQPQPDEGTFFQRDWFGFWDKLPNCRFYMTSDYAVTDGGGDYTVITVWGIDSEGSIYRVDQWKGQTSSDQWIERQLDLVARWKPLCCFGEGGVIQKAIEPVLKRRMRERGTYCRLEWMASVSDKPTRARSFQAMAAQGRVKFERGADLSEFLVFPAGKHDDEVDTASLIGRAVDQAHPAIVKGAETNKRRDRWDRESDDAGINWKTV
jgi:predicted phage terminase large subunit-like protein